MYVTHVDRCELTSISSTAGRDERLERAGAGELGDDASSDLAVDSIGSSGRSPPASRIWLIVAISSLSHAPTSSCWRRASAASDARRGRRARRRRLADSSSSSIASTSRLATRSIRGGDEIGGVGDQPALGEGHRLDAPPIGRGEPVRRFDATAGEAAALRSSGSRRSRRRRDAAAAGEHGSGEWIVGELEHGGRDEGIGADEARDLVGIERCAPDHRQRGLDSSRGELLEALPEPFEPDGRGPCRLVGLAVHDDGEGRLGDHGATP